MPPDTPPPVDSALPPVSARVAAFVAILLGGAAGGLIGYSFARFQCDGRCTLIRGSSLLVGAVICAAGVAVVAVLTLRTLTEWDRPTPR